MRVTHRQMASVMSEYMAENLDRLTKLQEQVASGKQFSRPSDNPFGAISAIEMRLSLKVSKSHLDTAQISKEWMGVTEMALGQMSDVASQAIDLALKGLSDTEGQDELLAFSGELEGLLQQAIDVSNTNLSGSYIFAGYQTDVRPYALVSGSPDTVAYAGDAGVMQRTIGLGHKINLNVDSEPAFSQLFGAMVRTRDALAADDKTEIQSGLSDLQSALGTLGEIRTTNAGRQKQLTSTIERLEGTQVEIQKLLAIREDIDMAEAITYLRSQETVYEAVLEVSQRAIATANLFQYLR